MITAWVCLLGAVLVGFVGNSVYFLCCAQDFIPGAVFSLDPAAGKRSGEHACCWAGAGGG